MRFKCAHICGTDGYLVFNELTMSVIAKGISHEKALEIVEILDSQVVRPALKEPLQIFNFDEIYRHYPRKGPGKKQGFEWLKKNIKSEKQFDNCLVAVGKYAAFVADNHTEEQYIKHFSTWVKHYTDWLEDTQVIRPKMSLDEINDLFQKP